MNPEDHNTLQYLPAEHTPEQLEIAVIECAERMVAFLEGRHAVPFHPAEIGGIVLVAIPLKVGEESVVMGMGDVGSAIMSAYIGIMQTFFNDGNAPSPP